MCFKKYKDASGQLYTDLFVSEFYQNKNLFWAKEKHSESAEGGWLTG